MRAPPVGLPAFATVAEGVAGIGVAAGTEVGGATLVGADGAVVGGEIVAAAAGGVGGGGERVAPASPAEAIVVAAVDVVEAVAEIEVGAPRPADGAVMIVAGTVVTGEDRAVVGEGIEGGPGVAGAAPAHPATANVRQARNTAETPKLLLSISPIDPSEAAGTSGHRRPLVPAEPSS